MLNAPIFQDVNMLRWALACASMVLMLGGLAVVLRRWQQGNLTGPARPKRLKVIETTWLDTKRRLVLIQHDGQEHLLLLGTNSETVLQSAAAPAEASEMIREMEDTSC